MSDWIVYPEEWFHLHGKAMSGHRHSHPMRPGEDCDDPDHDHPVGDPDGPADYPHPEHSDGGVS